MRSPSPAAHFAVLAHFPPDPDSPYVPHGLGAPKGLSVWEHVLFGVRFPHPDDEHQELLPQRALDAVNFELLHGSEFIDAFRSLELERLRHSARDLQRHRDQWLQANRHGDSDVNPVAANLHGPLFLAVARSVNCEELDPSFLDDLPGFPLVEQLPMSGPDTRVDGHPTWNPLTVEELREQRLDRNLKIVSSMRSSEYDDDLMQMTLNDAADGFSTYPEPLTVVHLLTVNLARRFPVREERSKCWRTRAIDDETEGGLNHTTLSSDRARHDGIRDLASGALLFLRQGIVPKFGSEI